MADQILFEGDYYQAVFNSTAPGQSPLTHPLNWSRVLIPRRWRPVLARLTYAHLLELDGQKEKADLERNVALTIPRTGLEDMVRADAQLEQWRARGESPFNGGPV